MKQVLKYSLLTILVCCSNLIYSAEEPKIKSENKKLNAALARLMGGSSLNSLGGYLSEDQRKKEISDLIKKGASPRAVLDEALVVAVGFPPQENVREKTISDLIRKGANPNAILDIGDNTYTLLMNHYTTADFETKYPMIFYASNAEVLAMLLDAGANIDAVSISPYDDSGETLLIKVVKSDEYFFETLSWLLREPIRDPEMQLERTSEYREKLDKFRRIIGTLIRYGANLNVKDKKGKTVFDYAIHDKVVIKMLNNAKKIGDEKIKEALHEYLPPVLSDIVCEYN